MSNTRSIPGLLPALAVAGTVLTWSASFPAIRFALRELSPLPLASLRFALAALLVGAWLAWRRPRGFSARDYGRVALCGCLGIALYNILLNLGQAEVSAGAASFIVNTQPLFMALLAVIFLREVFTPWGWLGAVTGLAGVAVIAWGQPGGIAFGAGSSLVLGAAVCAALYSVLQRDLLQRLAPPDVTAFVLLAGAVMLLPWLRDGLSQVRAAGTDTMLSVIFLAIGPGIVGQACWTYAIRSFGAARAGMFLYLIPPCAVVLAWIALGEAPSLATLLGGSLALAGVVIVNSLGRRGAQMRPLPRQPEPAAGRD